MKTLVVLAILAIAGLANAQSSANANATANATIVCPISIIDNATNGNLEFGTIVNTATGGTMTVPTSGSPTFTGGLTSYTGSVAHNTPHPANYTVGGQQGFGYSITPSIVTNFGAGCVLSALTSSLGASSTFTGTIGACVTNPLTIGGTITVSSGVSGSFTATINVAVAYN